MTEKIMELSEAIRKITQVPAQAFCIKKRGELSVGNYADLVVFDPFLIRDLASYTHPKLKAEGIFAVYVNGKSVYQNGKKTGNYSGKILKYDGTTT